MPDEILTLPEVTQLLSRFFRADAAYLELSVVSELRLLTHSPVC